MATPRLCTVQNVNAEWNEGEEKKRERLKVFLKRELVVCCGLVHYSHLLVFSNLFLKKVCLAFQRYVLHEVKWVLSMVDLKKRNMEFILSSSNCNQKIGILL